MLTSNPASSVPLHFSTQLPITRFAARMAGVTSLAIILIIRYAGVAFVCIRLIMLMAKDTLEGAEIVGIDMAIGAGCPSPLMPAGVDREIKQIVIPGARHPGTSVVAILAGGRETGRLVIRHGVIVVALVTGIALHGRVLIPVGVTGQAGGIDMRPGQRKLSGAVIECRR